MGYHSTARKTALLAVTAITLAACGGNTSAQTDEASGNSGEEITLRFGHLYETGHPFHACGAQPLADELASNGSGLNVEVFPAGQLGGEQELVQSTEAGDLDISIAGPGAVANWHAPWGVLDAAYAVNDWDHMQAVWESDIGDELRQGLLDDAGIRAEDLWLYGTRHVTANSAVRSPEDLAGKKMRAIDTPVSLANVRALGAEAVPVAFDELYLALQQGIVDGQENPIPTIQSGRFYEAQDVLSLTGHLVQSTMIMVSDQSWQKLSADQQEDLKAAFEKFGEDVRECVESEERDRLAEWESSGAFKEIVAPEDIDLDAFRERAAAEVPPQFADKWGADLYQRVRDLAGS